MTKEDFLRAAVAAAKSASVRSGLPPGLTVAQAALESAWGNSRLSREAHNYFGIKAHGKHAVIEMQTSEVRDGRFEQVSAKFARYASMEDCFIDRDRMITTSAIYANARACAGNVDEFARVLGKSWATDPGYAEKLLKLYRFNKLDAIDHV